MEQNTLKRRGVGLTGLDKERSFGGYTLLCPLTSDKAHLVDIDGKEVHTWKLPGRIGRHARILPNGNLAVNTLRPSNLTTKDGGPFPFPFFNKYGGGVMSELDPDGKVVRQFTDSFGHHDQYHYGDGRLLFTSLEALSLEESAKVIGGVPGSEIDGNTYADTINEVDSEGNVVWHWKVSERLPRGKFPLQPHYTREHYPLINSVLPMRDGKHILASLRSVSAVIIIERSTGDIVWELGPELLAQQHNATELDNGNILIFDNGTFRNGESITYTRAIEVDRATKKVVWEYRDRSQMHNFFTPFMGSAQRLANGNTLLCESAFGRILEVTKDGYVCWEFVNPHFAPYPDEATAKMFPGESNALFRAYRYSPEEIPWLKISIDERNYDFGEIHQPALRVCQNVELAQGFEFEFSVHIKQKCMYGNAGLRTEYEDGINKLALSIDGLYRSTLLPLDNARRYHQFTDTFQYIEPSIESGSLCFRYSVNQSQWFDFYIDSVSLQRGTAVPVPEEEE